MSVTLKESTLKKLDTLVTASSFTDQHVNKEYRFTDEKTIRLITPTTVPLVDYDPTGTGDRFGGNNELQDTNKTYTITQDKAFKLTIDRVNYIQGGRAKEAAKILKAQIDERVTPALDKYRLGVAADGAATAQQTVTFDEDNAYDNILDLGVYLAEAKLSGTRKVLYIDPTFYKLVKKEIVTDSAASGSADKLVGKGYMGMLDGTPVRVVPSEYFRTGVRALLVDEKALLGPEQINHARIITDSELVDGVVIVGRYVYDAFILGSRAKGVAAVVDSSYTPPVPSA